MAGFGFGADVDLISDPVIIPTSQNYMLLLHNNQLLTTEEVTKWKEKKKHMIYGLRSVTSQISQDKKVSHNQHHKKNMRRDCAHFSATCRPSKTFH